ncbi:hypothetical protein RBSH_01986 [Rhodopirellula baltica SH28]|uniref:Uncharacterized protein n=1 Tax=Rhodopirellula baltica SH28 TaxID=993517 RepID=K5DIM1_RHOBT|nr:hypothetical protein RBSH_01986 [Rhodopirellula baltica SH28]
MEAQDLITARHTFRSISGCRSEVSFVLQDADALFARQMPANCQLTNVIPSGFATTIFPLLAMRTFA